jgi:hypothetical protein
MPDRMKATALGDYTFVLEFRHQEEPKHDTKIKKRLLQNSMPQRPCSFDDAKKENLESKKGTSSSENCSN